MQSIRHQGLRVSKKSANDLKERQQQIYENTHPSALLRSGESLRVGRLEGSDIGLGMMRAGMIFHIGCVKMHLCCETNSTPASACGRLIAFGTA
jgi:hypothetical protein